MRRTAEGFFPATTIAREKVAEGNTSEKYRSLKSQSAARPGPVGFAAALQLSYQRNDMWTARHQPLDGGRITGIEIHCDSIPLSFSDALQLWQDSAGFREFFTEILASSPYSAFRWETPPLTISSANQPFQFVLLDSPSLDRRADPEAFAEHFQGVGDLQAVEFTNLGKDAILIVPTPIGSDTAYGHIAAFVRSAFVAQRHELWKLVGSAAQRRLGTKPFWLSTAGAGVSWLHVRLDDQPKYYGHRPYSTLNRSNR
jgi:hypothetical protein